MTITPRTLLFQPKEITVFQQGSVRLAPNTNNEQLKVPMVLAYRKTKGLDKRVRIVHYRKDIMGYPSIDMYYVDTPKKEIIPVTVGEINVFQNWGRSSSLGDWWVKEYQTGNVNFNEGSTYTLNRYSFDILDKTELDNLSASVLFSEWVATSDSFKY